MTLKDIGATVAKNVGIKAPDAVVGNQDPDCVKILQFANEAGQELARRVDWSGLRKTRAIIGTGFYALFDLPSDYARMTEGWGVTCDGNPVRGGLTSDEWNSISPVEGAPRYFQTVGQKIGFYPFPPEGLQITLSFISSNWTSSNESSFANDSDTTLFPEKLVEMGATWRFKRSVGADYSDYLAEFEAALQDYARNDGMVRLP